MEDLKPIGRPRRYTVHRRDGTTDEVEAEGMWPEAAHLVFRDSEVVIMQRASGAASANR
jgi:hypothetical protein